MLLGQVIERAINVSFYKVLRIAELMFRERHNNCNCGNTYSLWGCMTPQHVIKIMKPLLIWLHLYTHKRSETFNHLVFGLFLSWWLLPSPLTLLLTFGSWRRYVCEITEHKRTWKWLKPSLTGQLKVAFIVVFLAEFICSLSRCLSSCCFLKFSSLPVNQDRYDIISGVS